MLFLFYNIHCKNNDIFLSFRQIYYFIFLIVFLVEIIPFLSFKIKCSSVTFIYFNNFSFYVIYYCYFKGYRYLHLQSTYRINYPLFYIDLKN